MKRNIFTILFFAFSILLVDCYEHPVEPSKDQSIIHKYGSGGGGGGHTETLVNNLSFPALLASDYSLTKLPSNSFVKIYDGDYPGLTASEIAALTTTGPWYPQKTEGNYWQADYASLGSNVVSFVDWGDNIESMNPVLNRPFRLEVVLFAAVSSMTAYNMALLEYPSSLNELQGTNTTTYLSNWATVATNSAKLVIQKFPLNPPVEPVWNVNGYWEGLETPSNISFAMELNIAGKLIYGASEGGWKPTEIGNYRITFYTPSNMVDLSHAIIDNYANYISPSTIAVSAASSEGAGFPIVDVNNNLTYVDVKVVTSGGGGGKKGK